MNKTLIILCLVTIMTSCYYSAEERIATVPNEEVVLIRSDLREMSSSSEMFVTYDSAYQMLRLYRYWSGSPPVTLEGELHIKIENTSSYDCRNIRKERSR